MNKLTKLSTALLAAVLLAGCTTANTSEADSAETSASTSAASESAVSTDVTTESTAATTSVLTSESGASEPDVFDIINDLYDKQPEPPEIDLDTEKIKCLPIDKTLDCEAILLERADQLHQLIYDYKNWDVAKLHFGAMADCLAPVLSYELKTYEDVREIFTEVVWENYADHILLVSYPQFMEIDDMLCFNASPRGPVVGEDAWYLGYEVTDDKIIGHFTALKVSHWWYYDDADIYNGTDAEFYNDEENYYFYDIVVQNIDGEYLVTSCATTEGIMLHAEHGHYYGTNWIDKSIITNEKLKPAER